MFPCWIERESTTEHVFFHGTSANKWRLTCVTLTQTWKLPQLATVNGTRVLRASLKSSGGVCVCVSTCCLFMCPCLGLALGWSSTWQAILGALTMAHMGWCVYKLFLVHVSLYSDHSELVVWIGGLAGKVIYGFDLNACVPFCFGSRQRQWQSPPSKRLIA